MSVRGFADTNVLIYAAVGQSDPIKAAQANQALRATQVISAQVLNEFVNVTRNKLRLPWNEVEGTLEAIRQAHFEVLPVTYEIHVAARELSRHHNLRIYDACIVAAAIEAECDTLWSEDLQAGRRFGSLTVRNPFEGL